MKDFNHADGSAVDSTGVTADSAGAPADSAGGDSTTADSAGVIPIFA